VVLKTGKVFGPAYVVLDSYSAIKTGFWCPTERWNSSGIDGGTGPMGDGTKRTVSGSDQEVFIDEDADFGRKA